MYAGATLSLHKRYVMGIEYTGANLEAIYHAEGRVVPIGGGVFQYEYTLKDHLGNSRVIFAANGTAINLLQENHYYPFGMEMKGAWITQLGTENGYQYTGKELNEDWGLNWSDYGARWYDASVGRWNSIDPLAEKFVPWSSYNYAFNNPLRFVDPDGMKPLDDYFNAKTGEYIGSDNKDTRKIRLVGESNLQKVKEVFKDQKVSSQEEELLEASSHGPTYGELDDGASEKVINYYYQEAGFDLNELEGSSILVDGEYSNLAGTRKSKKDPAKLYIRVDDKSICTDCALRNGSDIINMVVHERGGHGRDHFKGLKYNWDKDFWDWEKRATRLQIDHPSWPKTSKGFKNVVWDAYGKEEYIVPKEQRYKYFGKYGVGK